jgi:putative heme-binding domain-containing protein
VLAKADASRGREVYAATCGTCHPLFGEGTALGPDLTGSNRADLGYLLENVLAPSAVVAKEYMLQIFTMKDGTVVSGTIREQTPGFAKVSMPGGSTVELKLAEVAKREEVPQSLMPAGLFEALPAERVADLVKYLASPVQRRGSSASRASGLWPAPRSRGGKSSSRG